MSTRLVLAAVIAVSVPRAMLAQAAPPKRQLVQEMRLDASTEDFPDVQGVHVSPRGQVVVMVSADQQLRFYDPAGKKTATFGRVGSGPGEFRRAVWFGWIADTLWAYDTDQRRISYISPATTLVRTEVH